MEEIRYEVDFDDQVERISQEIKLWFAGPRKKLPEIDHFPEPVFFKSSRSVVVHSNIAYQDFFSSGVTVVGRLASSYLHSSVSRAAALSDSLILAGADYLKFEHDCMGPNNRWSRVVTYKENLLNRQDAAFDILGVSRAIARESTSAHQVNTIESYYLSYKQMEPTDKQICVLIAEGRSMKEIATVLGVTSKTVENHRRKILDQFQFDLPIDIVKTMVRFEERGFNL